MAKQDHDAAELDQAEEVGGVPLVAGHEAAELLEPREEPFDLPAAAVPAQGPPVLGGHPAAPTVWCNEDDVVSREARIEGVAIVGPIPDHSPRTAPRDARRERRLDEGDFMRRSTCDGNGDRKTSAVCKGHDLGPLPAPSGPDEGAPPLAPAKVPSMKHSERSSPPRASRSRARERRTLASVPLSTQY